MIRPYRGVYPHVATSAFLAEDAVIIGDVEVAEDASIWYGVVLRGDVNQIRIGEATNVQDCSVVHCSPNQPPTVLESWVTVGHSVTLHGCHVRERSLIGMGAVVLDGAVVGEESIVGANALVPPGAEVPPRTLVTGSPARFARRLREEDIDWIVDHARYYVSLKRTYLTEGAGQLIPQPARRRKP